MYKFRRHGNANVKKQPASGPHDTASAHRRTPAGKGDAPGQERREQGFGKVKVVIIKRNRLAVSAKIRKFAPENHTKRLAMRSFVPSVTPVPSTPAADSGTRRPTSGFTEFPLFFVANK